MEKSYQYLHLLYFVKESERVEEKGERMRETSRKEDGDRGWALETQTKTNRKNKLVHLLSLFLLDETIYFRGHHQSRKKARREGNEEHQNVEEKKGNEEKSLLGSDTSDILDETTMDILFELLSFKFIALETFLLFSVLQETFVWFRLNEQQSGRAVARWRLDV